MTRFEHYKSEIAKADVVDMAWMIGSLVEEPCEFCAWQNKVENDMPWCWQHAEGCMDGVIKWLLQEVEK